MKTNNLLENYMENNILNLEKVINNYSGYVYTIVKNASANNFSEEDIEEIIADTFFVLWKNHNKIRKDVQVSSYLAGISKNIIYEKIRKNKTNFQNIELDKLENVLKENYNIEIEYEKKEKIRQVEQKLNKMSKQDKDIFILFYYENRKISEIAQILNISESKVKTRLHRIRKKLKKEVAN